MTLDELFKQNKSEHYYIYKILKYSVDNNILVYDPDSESKRLSARLLNLMAACMSENMHNEPDYYIIDKRYKPTSHDKSFDDFYGAIIWSDMSWVYDVFTKDMDGNPAYYDGHESCKGIVLGIHVGEYQCEIDHCSNNSIMGMYFSDY